MESKFEFVQYVERVEGCPRKLYSILKEVAMVVGGIGNLPYSIEVSEYVSVAGYVVQACESQYLQ